MIHVLAMYHDRITCDTCIMTCISVHYDCIIPRVVADVETAARAILVHVLPSYYDRPRLVVSLAQRRVVDTCITRCIINVLRMY